MSTHRADGIRDAQAGRPPTPPAAPWKAYEQAIQAEYMDGYSQQGRAAMIAMNAARTASAIIETTEKATT